MNSTYSPGLEGVVAGESAICTVEEGLQYRGYPVEELAEKATFEETAYLLLHGDLPNTKQLAGFRDRLVSSRQVPDAVHTLFRTLPRWSQPLDALRTGISILAQFDPDANDSSRDAELRKAERLLAQIPCLIADQFRIAKGLHPISPPNHLDTANGFLFMLRGAEPQPAEAKALDVSLILYAEHEFNASTFTARTIVSTESDLHSGVIGAIGALKGRLHGGANEKVMDVLMAAGGPDSAEAWVRAALARKERIMGFGHRVYKRGDVRAAILKEFARSAAAAVHLSHWEETADIIERIIADEKKLYPNLDWPAGRLYHALGLEIPLYTPIFAMSRITGWSAHIIEQRANNRLIRPRGLYTGPSKRTVVPLDERT